jgi:integrase
MTRVGRALGPGRLLRRGENSWTLDYVDATGARRRQVLSRDKRNAERMRAQLIGQRDLQLAGMGSIEGQQRSLAELAQRYFGDLVVRVSRAHFANARTRILRVLAGVRVRRVCDLQVHHVLEFRARRVAAGLSHASANHEIRNTRSMLVWAVRAGLIAENPLRSIKPLPLDRWHLRRRRRSMSDAEIERFLSAARADDVCKAAYKSAAKTIAKGWKGKLYAERPRVERVPQYVMWLAFLETGARYTELVSTRWGDLDGSTLTLRAITTKSGKTRVIPVRDGLVQELAALRRVQGRALGRALTASDYIFLSPEGQPLPKAGKRVLLRLWQVLKRAGISRVDAHGDVLDIHSLRHTCASRMARAGVPIVHTQRLLGHSSIELTSKYYVHVGVDDLRLAVARIGPAYTSSGLNELPAAR